MNARREMRHHPPAPDKQPITESPTMRSFDSKGITSPVVFKAIGFSRRVQLWNRQASIIMDLTTLALRHGGHVDGNIQHGVQLGFEELPLQEAFDHAEEPRFHCDYARLGLNEARPVRAKWFARFQPSLNIK